MFGKIRALLFLFFQKETNMDYLRNKEPPFALKAKSKYKKKGNKNEL